MNEIFAESLLNDIDLKQMALEVLRNALGHSMQISMFSREKNPRSTKFPTELLHIETLDNRKVSLFVKHLDHEDSQLSGKGDLYDGDDDPYHEIRVYNEFLNDGVSVLVWKHCHHDFCNCPVIRPVVCNRSNRIISLKNRFFEMSMIFISFL